MIELKTLHHHIPTWQSWYRTLTKNKISYFIAQKAERRNLVSIVVGDPQGERTNQSSEEMGLSVVCI